jgi:hypothetical protein
VSRAYVNAGAFRVALERRLRDRAVAEGVRLDRLRRQVMVERFLARLEATEPGRWVLEGARRPVAGLWAEMFAGGPGISGGS